MQTRRGRCNKLFCGARNFRDINQDLIDWYIHIIFVQFNSSNFNSLVLQLLWSAIPVNAFTDLTCP